MLERSQHHSADKPIMHSEVCLDLRDGLHNYTFFLKRLFTFTAPDLHSYKSRSTVGTLQFV